MSDTDALTQAAKAVKAAMGLGGVLSDNEAQKYARAALEAAGALSDGSQPMPQPGTGPSCHDLVIQELHDEWGTGASVNRLVQDLVMRREFGQRKYGRPLQAHNGRSAVTDAYQEVLDLLAYLAQLKAEGGHSGLGEYGPHQLFAQAISIALDLASVQE